MKRVVVLLFLGLLSSMAYCQTMKMVVDNKGNVVGRFVKANASTYTIEVQETTNVSKSGKRVVTFSAINGQGVVYRNQLRTGNIRVRKSPSTSSDIVAKIPEPDGVPDTYPCLGKVNGWYKIKIDGKIGYVREDMACWDGMDTF